LSLSDFGRLSYAGSVTGNAHHTDGMKLNFMIFAITALALGYFAFDKFAPDTPQKAELTQTRSEANSKSIAVLAFVNMSKDPDQARCDSRGRAPQNAPANLL